MANDIIFEQNNWDQLDTPETVKKLKKLLNKIDNVEVAFENQISQDEMDKEQANPQQQPA